VDSASLDADTRRQLTAGQAATLTARGAGGDVVTATDVQVDQASSPRTFSTVSGTVQARTQARLVFLTREGFTLQRPDGRRVDIDTSGLPPHGRRCPTG
jgi:hypothetical protein